MLDARYVRLRSVRFYEIASIFPLRDPPFGGVALCLPPSGREGDRNAVEGACGRWKTKMQKREGEPLPYG